MIRKPSAIGTFYPNDKDLIEGFLNDVLKEKKELKPKALIVPHAGYMFSGEVAGKAFSYLNKKYEEVIILCPNHSLPCNTAAVDLRDYETPLGIVKNSPKSIKISKEKFFEENEEIHDKEHAIEVIIPFLQKKLSNFKIIPIIVGEVNTEEVAKTLSNYIKKNTLLIISTDLSHFHEYDEANGLDKETIKAIENFDEECIKEVCGINALKVLIKIAKVKNWKIKSLEYKNSGDVIVAKNSVVGYYAAILY